MTIEELRGYEQVRTPDVAALAKYLNLAKGPNRTMAQFAADTEISASTLSRILNMNIKKPLSKEMIISIFEHRASPEDEHLLASLARANGLASPDYVERVNSHHRNYARRNEELNKSNLMKNAILAGIVAAGTPVKGIFSGRVLQGVEEEHGLPLLYKATPCDFFIALGENTSAKKIWRVHTYPGQLDEEDMRYPNPEQMALRWFLQRLAPFFLRDAWDAVSLDDTKTSFAFIDERLFYAFIEMMQSATLNSEMSVLLLDPSNGYSVTKEAWLNGNFSRLTEMSVFEAPAPTDYEEDDDDFYGYKEDADDEE